MDTSTFYATSSALSFTLLGFWWVVVEYRHSDLVHEVAGRRFAFLVSLHFILPGLVSLASLLATGPLWRVAFGLAGLTGVAAAVIGTGRLGAAGAALRGLARWAWLGLPVYAVITAVAAVPDLVRTGLALEPLQVEGFMLLAILLLGVLLAWMTFTASGDEAGRAVDA